MKQVSKKTQLNRVSKSFCPFCRSDCTEYEDLTVDCGQVSQRATCSTCDAIWYENYKLYGITVVEESREER